MDGRRRERLWQEVTRRAARDGAGMPAAVCATCVGDLADGAALSMRSAGRTQELLATSGPWASKLEEAQYALGEGPGVLAYTGDRPVLIADITAEDGRWPMFTDAARAEGVAAVFAFPLHSGAIRLGTLDLYRRAPGRLTPDALADATVLADLAMAVVLRQALDDEAAGLDPAEQGGGAYEDVHIATGMVAVQLRISLADASVRLRAHAFAEGRSLLEVSRDVIARRITLDRWAE
ncbi:GAF domain-containing protein [Amycolatopsis australiensis]|uniref:GAF domain-containing protein n=1 Tax=Amycolatopsis australiensis TaxID=546364 RepID=A0A1K1SRM3_9PSEU|nr:GAF domain-containing protein [Amycolatopsis australiensis]SFW86971.1 GAF domain-containing protein [Amycolatopsis australiensis]